MPKQDRIFILFLLICSGTFYRASSYLMIQSTKRDPLHSLNCNCISASCGQENGSWCSYSQRMNAPIMFRRLATVRIQDILYGIFATPYYRYHIVPRVMRRESVDWNDIESNWIIIYGKLDLIEETSSIIVRRTSTVIIGSDSCSVFALWDWRM